MVSHGVVWYCMVNNFTGVFCLCCSVTCLPQVDVLSPMNYRENQKMMGRNIEDKHSSELPTSAQQ